ncbi:MAG: potassium transporter Kup [Alphaproteobacteria bacterium]|nr:potassium transporter Kup [Alphaproteobacteria bacterium]
MSSGLEAASGILPGEEDAQGKDRRRFYGLLVGCIGVVYGDIGTSPLYAFREAAHHIATDGVIKPVEIYGIISLIFWALTLVVTIKYVLFLLHLDNRGEGGIISLMAMSQKAVGKRLGALVFFLALVGTGLFYGDAMITPAISVLSAVEGLKLIAPDFDGMILPFSIFILFFLFLLQKKGTASVSILFGPIMVVWFLTLGLLGISWIVYHPDILFSFNPVYAIAFLWAHGSLSLVVLGSVFLAVTGAEALYADLGHFGRKPIQVAWLVLVFPCLLLNYMGQGALLLEVPAALDNPFYRLVPEWGLWPLLALATSATIIASQAMITGAYSVTRQAMNLGLLPRMEVQHTSEEQEGQVYMPKINNILLAGVVFLCLVFHTSSALASAYGIAVIGTIAVGSILAFIVLWKVKKKNPWLSALFILPFFIIEMVFVTANLLKLFDGGIFPLMFAAVLVIAMLVWVKGSRYLHKKAQRGTIQLSDLVEQLEREPLPMVTGTAVYLTSDPAYVPIAMSQNMKHNKILHENNIILSVIPSQFPRVPESQRVMIQPISSHMTRIFVNYGFMETPHIPRALMQAKTMGMKIDLDDISYFVGKRTVVSDPVRGLPPWQDKIYIAMLKSATAATDFYRLPPDRVIEMGIQMTV